MMSALRVPDLPRPIRPPWAGLARVLAAALVAILAPGGSAAQVARLEARVSYLAGGSVYVDAGRSKGLREGDSLVVVHDGKAIAWLRASYLSSQRAACDTLRTLAPIQIGDLASFASRTPEAGVANRDTSAAETSAPPGVASPLPSVSTLTPASGVTAGGNTPATPRVREERRAGSLRGRIGARFLTVQTAGGGRLTQPALDVRLDGASLAGTPLDLAVDFRGRRVARSFPGRPAQNDDRGLFYRFSLATRDPKGHYRLSLGRQLSPALAAVNLFDGVLAEQHGRRWSVGVFSGTQPEPLRLGVSGSILQGGGYLEWHQPAASARRWSVTGGAITSYDHGNTNRDFGFMRVFYLDRVLSATLSQEADLNRGWKRDLGQPALQATGTFLTTNVRVGSALSLRAGYDNRRNVWLYRDRITPENLFDDRYRQGGWGGALLDVAHHVRLTGDRRTSSIAGARRQNGWTGGLEGYRFTPLNLTARARYSRLTGAGMENTLASFSIGLDPLASVHLEAAAGRRTTKDLIRAVVEQTKWQSADFDLTLVRSAYLNASFESDAGDIGRSQQAYLGLSWRF
jgi:hypothetical protein